MQIQSVDARGSAVAIPDEKAVVVSAIAQSSSLNEASGVGAPIAMSAVTSNVSEFEGLISNEAILERVARFIDIDQLKRHLILYMPRPLLDGSNSESESNNAPPPRVMTCIKIIFVLRSTVQSSKDTTAAKLSQFQGEQPPSKEALHRRHAQTSSSTLQLGSPTLQLGSSTLQLGKSTPHASAVVGSVSRDSSDQPQPPKQPMATATASCGAVGNSTAEEETVCSSLPSVVARLQWIMSLVPLTYFKFTCEGVSLRATMIMRSPFEAVMLALRVLGSFQASPYVCRFGVGTG